MNDKYIAGFIDADGSFDIRVNKVNGRYYITPRLRICQKFVTTLELIQSHFGWGNIRKTKQGYFEYAVAGKKAKTVISRLHQHFILKQAQAKFIVDFDFSGSWDKGSIKDLKKLLKELRFTEGTKRSFPSRKWLAGYVDGDGCVTATLRKDRSKPSIAFMITVDNRDIRGIQLIQKNFGGFIQSKTATTSRLDIWLNRTNCEKLFTYFNKHLLLKGSQFDLVLDWFRNKHDSTSRETTQEFITQLRHLKNTGND